MNENRDPRLQDLFARSQQELDGEAFTKSMMARTRFQRYRAPILLSGIALVVAICTLLFTPSLLEFVLLVTEVLTRTLLDLGNGWLAWVFLPINNIASLLILSGKAMLMGWKSISRAGYTN